MITFYIEETQTTIAKEKCLVLWMEKSGRKFFIDSTWHFVSEEDDSRFQKKMAQLYSTDGAYFGSEEDIVEFTDRIRKNDYHLDFRSNFNFVNKFDSDVYYTFYGTIVETNERFWFYIYDIMNPEIARAKIIPLLKKRIKIK